MSRRLRIVTNAPLPPGVTTGRDVQVLDGDGNDLAKTLLIESLTIEIGSGPVTATLRIADVEMAIDAIAD